MITGAQHVVRVAFSTPRRDIVTEISDTFRYSQLKLAQDINIPLRRINELCRGKRGITPDTAIRLGVYFQVAAEFWLSLQVRHELALLQEKEGSQIKREIRAFSGGSGGLIVTGIDRALG